jgi:uncharacterized RDD family membrane protein YckC
MPSPFAGFWLRFVAFLIDWLVLIVGYGVVAAIVIGVIGLGAIRSAFDNVDDSSNFFPVSIFFGILLAIVVLIAGTWLYYAWMESSTHQGTLGKMSLGLIVTDLQGRRVSFGRATGRFFAKIISGKFTFYVGYIMAGLTEKKQALHDMIASCLVLRKT